MRGPLLRGFRGRTMTRLASGGIVSYFLYSELDEGILFDFFFTLGFIGVPIYIYIFFLKGELGLYIYIYVHIPFKGFYRVPHSLTKKPAS